MTMNNRGSEGLEGENQRLREENAQLRAENAQLRAVIAELQRRVGDLERALANRLSKNSQNSHRPPSSDFLHSSKGGGKKPSGRKPGGQPGRVFKTRSRLPPTQRTVIRPRCCDHCHADLKLGDKVGESVYQRVDIPRVSLLVTDFVCETVACPACLRNTTGKAEHQGQGRFIGPRLAAVMATLSGQFHLSKRQVQEALSSILGVDIGLGSVSNVEQRVSCAIKPAYDEAVLAVQTAPVVNADETGWKERSRLAWLWSAATPEIAVFQVQGGRGSEAARRLLSADFSGVLISDRWGAYNWVDDERRQFCWAHLLRDFRSWQETGGRGSSYGGKLHDLGKETIHLWKTASSIAADPASLRLAISDHQSCIHALLKKAQYHGTPSMRRTAKRLLSQEPCLWLFLRQTGVQPTNNHAERVLRQAVLWRKKSFGTVSGMGSTFVERILTAVSSLKLQGRSVLDFLCTSLENLERREVAPTLVPSNLRLAAASGTP